MHKQSKVDALSVYSPANTCHCIYSGLPYLCVNYKSLLKFNNSS